jgi:carbon-monoxide dehydrogenase large subunit
MRSEDPGLLTGRTRFTGDLGPASTASLVLVRSAVAHGEITAIELEAAGRAPGVIGAYDAHDLAGLGIHPMPCSWITPGQEQTAIPPLAASEVVYAGQPVAVIVAEDLYLAHDAADRVAVHISPRPAVLDPERGDVVAEIEVGGGDAHAAVQESEVRVGTKLYVQRQAAAPLEGRATVAVPDPESGRLTAWLSTQAAHHARAAITAACGWPEDRLRVILPAVGGGFGLKEYVYPEDAVVCLLAAHLSRPVRWVEDRRENLTSACHARQSVIELELGADADGRVTAITGTWLWDLGGHPSAHGLGPARFGAAMITGPYRIAACRILVRGVITNKAPIGGYRGYGVPQAHLAMERALDALAARLGATPDEVRRINLLTARELPRAMPSGVELDSGDYLGAYEEMLAATAQAAAETVPAEGGAIGAGAVPYTSISGMGPSRGAAGSGLDTGSFETAHARIDRDGAVVIHVGTSAQGQGHATLLANVAARALDIAPDRVRVVAGDTDLTPYSPVSAVGSRTAAVVAGAVRAACAPLAEKLARQAAHHPESTRSELAAELIAGHDLAPGVDPGLESVATVDPPAAAMTYGVHGAVIEVDAELGTIAVRRYLALDDCGPRLEPQIVEGQLRGAIVQGIGSALLEELRYDADGTPATTSLSDYLLPNATTVPAIEFTTRETPSPSLPGGAKGVGEAGILAPPAAIAQALDAALGRPAAAVTELPFTPERVCTASDEAVPA